jgi:hypothetical protein
VREWQEKAPESVRSSVMDIEEISWGTGGSLMVREVRKGQQS